MASDQQPEGNAIRGLEQNMQFGNGWRQGFIAAVAGLWTFAGPAHAETLQDALRQALAGNPDLAAQRADLRGQQESIVQANAVNGWRAEASGNVAGAFSNALRGGETRNLPVGASLGATFPIYSGGRNEARIEQARKGFDAALLRYLIAEQAVLADVVTAYSNVRRDQEILSIRNNNVSVLSRQLEATRARFEVGEVTRTDIAQAEARLAGAKAAAAGAQSQLDVSKAAYTRVVGMPPGALAGLPAAPGLPASIEGALTSALENSPVVLASKAAVEAARAAVRLADADFRPTATVGISADANVADLTDWDLQRSGGFTASARVTVPIFTNGLTRSAARQAREAETAARIRVRSSEMDVEQRVGNAWTLLAASRAVILATREQVRAAEVALEGARNELEVGSRTTLDVLDQEQELLEARLALANAERDAFVNAHQVLQAMGTLTPDVYGVEAPRVASDGANTFISTPGRLSDDLRRAFAKDPAAVDPVIETE